MTNDKAHALEVTNAKWGREVFLDFRHLGFICHLDFDIWNSGFGAERL
jgi:hypothetical protein